jgi:2-polyprenyl-6-methoxyphenol hydroxylase-like FAD-dependent oxidoreductase
MPPFISDRAPRAGDERFVAVTARRPVIEYAVASIADGSIDVRRGVAVTELMTGEQAARGVPHVTGVRTATGEQLEADLIIDSMGRGSSLTRWLADLGARPLSEEAEDSGFTYYSRYFRSPTGTMPPFLGGTLTEFDCYSLLTIPGDACTWSVTIYISSRDRALKELRHLEKWSAVVKECPLHAHLLDGEPISEILPMSGVVDRHRRAVSGDTPVVTGLVAVGDSLCCSNPSLGRGISLGLIQAVGTAEVVRDHLGDPVALARAHDQMIQAQVMPWYWNTVGVDRARKAQMDAAIEGRPPPAHDGAPNAFESLLAAMPFDADLFRAAMEHFTMLALPEEILFRPGISERVMSIGIGREVPQMPGPSRSELLQLLA